MLFMFRFDVKEASAIKVLELIGVRTIQNNLKGWS